MNNSHTHRGDGEGGGAQAEGTRESGREKGSRREENNWVRKRGQGGL